jgi:hypothetical protein
VGRVHTLRASAHACLPACLPAPACGVQRGLAPPPPPLQAEAYPAFPSCACGGLLQIGDSWLFGAPGDPFKLSVFRETRRAVQDAVRAGALAATNPMLHDFNRRILKCPEHK